MPSGVVALMSAPASISTGDAREAALARGEQQRRQAAGRQPLVARLGRALPLPFLDDSSGR